MFCFVFCEFTGHAMVNKTKWSLMLLCLYASWGDNEKIDNMRTIVLKAEELDIVGDSRAPRRSIQKSGD